MKDRDIETNSKAMETELSPISIIQHYDPSTQIYVRRMTRLVNQMKQNEIRSASLINIGREIHMHDIIKKFENSYRQTFPVDRICFFDWDIFSPFERSRRKSLLPGGHNKKYSDLFLDLSLKVNQANKVGPGLVNFNIEAEGGYILCEMHLVYLFERIFMPIIKRFNPHFVIIASNESMISGKMSDNLIYNGDGNIFY